MKPRRHRGRAKAVLMNQRGVALILVLWIFTFLFVVAFDFVASVREEATASLRYGDETEGYYFAVAGFQKGLFDFLNQQGQSRNQLQPEGKVGILDGKWLDGKLGKGEFRVRLVDEGGKININRIDEETLKRILGNIGIEEPQRGIIADSIMDWRDSDDLHRTSGAENDYYANLAQPYSAKNGPLDVIEDLLWIRGITAGLFFGYADNAAGVPTAGERIPLREIFTVDSPIDRINLRTASATVIHAVLGIPLEKSRVFVEEREKLSEKTLNDLLPLLGISAGDRSLQSFVFTNPSVVALEAEGWPAGSRVRRRVKGVLRLGGRQGFELLRWIDRETVLPLS